MRNHSLGCSRGFWSDVRVMLFGSRVDDSVRGEDINLFVDSSANNDIMTKENWLAVQLQMRVGEQKIDIVIASDASRLVGQEARPTGVVYEQRAGGIESPQGCTRM